MKRTLIWLAIGYIAIILCFFAWNDIQSADEEEREQENRIHLTELTSVAERL